MPRVAAILAAAGRGARFGTGENKVFAPLAGRTVLAWSLRALDRSPSVADILVAIAPDDGPRVDAILAEVASEKVRGVCHGGAERQDTVRNALQALPGDAELVAIHDGARPLARPELIEAVIQAAAEHGAALPATAVVDTLKRSADGVDTRETVSRVGLYGVQTPQVFRRALLVEAYASARGTDFTGTDDAAYVQRLGHPVHLVPGDRENIKITLPADLEHAERLMRASTPTRTGFGYDVHPLAAGRNLVLGGVPLEFDRGLDGHSDADVLLHAICDALLGAACLGDIGLHFPNTDARFKDVSSLTLLEHVGTLLAERGFVVQHVDCMLLAEAPKIRPHVDRMRANIAGAIGIGVDTVNVKATTSERLGFVGREEGMAAYAVATVRGAGPL